jgi:hypothetical protein
VWCGFSLVFFFFFFSFSSRPLLLCHLRSAPSPPHLIAPPSSSLHRHISTSDQSSFTKIEGVGLVFRCRQAYFLALESILRLILLKKIARNDEPVAGSLSFSVRRKSGRRGLWVAALAVSGGRVWAMSFIWLLIGCFIFILSFCIFVKIMRCQLVISGQKSLLLRDDRMAASLN